MEYERIRISKLDAAKRQLDSAIELWFLDKDVVSVHTLAHAAYQVIHDINERRGVRGKLLYGSDYIRRQYQKMVERSLKDAGNFFKHADKDPERVIEFPPFSSVGFILFAIQGLELLGEGRSELGVVFGLWIAFHEPGMVNDCFIQQMRNVLPVEDAEYFRGLSKGEFLKQFMRASRTLCTS